MRASVRKIRKRRIRTRTDSIAFRLTQSFYIDVINLSFKANID
jgi:hypothetical protein